MKKVCDACRGSGFEWSCGREEWDHSRYQNCSRCHGSGELPQTAMILHETERDPYGVLTLGLMHDMRTLADGFVQGWEAHRVHVNEWFPHHFWEAVNRPARYADVRDFIHTYADFPPTMVQAVALWMTREEGNVDGFWLPFPNVL